jgi:hypothetical protein
MLGVHTLRIMLLSVLKHGHPWMPAALQFSSQTVC